MNEGIDVGDYTNKFDKYRVQLLSIEVKIDGEVQHVILLATLLKSYETLMIIILIGKMISTINEVSTTLSEPKYSEE